MSGYSFIVDMERLQRHKTALVLSGGGLFGAWQAGAWRALADRLQPDLVVGASVGSLNGYAIAGGATPAELAQFWLRPGVGRFDRLPSTIRALMSSYRPRVEYAVVLTDVLRMKPRVFRGSEITWRHLAASCAIPGLLKPYRINGRLYADGGLLNPLPVYAAIDLGATRIVALNALPGVPSPWMKPFVKSFRGLLGHHPALPPHVELTLIETNGAIGSVSDVLRWRRENIERWLALGYSDACRAYEIAVSI